MSGELYPYNSWEVATPLNPEADLNVATITNFQERGRKAAHLVLAALTESVPISGFRAAEIGACIDDGPAVPGREVELHIARDESEIPAEIEQTLFAARTLQEYLAADAPGSRRIKLESYDTRYEKIWKRLVPGKKDNESQRSAFGDAMMDSIREGGVPLRSPDQARLIVGAAPRSLTGLRLTSIGTKGYTETKHDVVTTGGRLVRVRGTEKYGKSPSYWLPYETRSGGRARWSDAHAEHYT